MHTGVQRNDVTNVTDAQRVGKMAFLYSIPKIEREKDSSYSKVYRIVQNFD